MLDAYSTSFASWIDDLDLPSSLPSLPTTDVLGKLSNFSFVNEGTFDWMKNRDFMVGEMLKEEGLSAVHPVILIPVSEHGGSSGT